MGKKIWESAKINGYETTLWEEQGKHGPFLQLQLKRSYKDKRTTNWRDMVLTVLPQHINVFEELIKQGIAQMRTRDKTNWKERNKQ